MIDQMNRLIMLGAGRHRYRFYDEVTQVHRLSPSEIAALQLTRLKALLIHAGANVPYYRDTFERIKFNPAQIDSVDALRDLPILDRPTLRTQLERLVASDFDRRRLLFDATGGSTGEPVRFYKETDCFEREMALLWRSWSWAGWHPGDKMVWIWGAPTESSQLDSFKGRMKWRLGGRLLLDAFDMASANLGNWVEQINAFGAEHILGYATSLDTFAQYLISEGITLEPRVKQVISTAEKLREDQRKRIEQAFKCKVRDQYGCREIRMVGFECSQGNMHIASDSVVVEFLDDPAVPNSKRIVCTALHGLAMPLIRYDVGDYGRPVDGQCGCGIHFPMMAMDVGRVSDNFVTPSGRVVHGEYFTHLMYGIDGVSSFQFYQKIPGVISLYVVLNNGTNPIDMNGAFEPVCRGVQSIDEAIELRIEYTKKIDKTRSGKHRFTVCEVGQC